MQSTEQKRPFLPAKPSPWLLPLAQNLAAIDLAINNRIRIDEADLNNLRHVPQDSGVMLVSNHADETDARLLMDLSRRAGKRFIMMCNREAFDELGGIAGWALQRIGSFSVERGAHDLPAKQYAVDVLKNGKDVLVVFPEGEIYYLNESLQPFHSGAINIGLEAIMEQRKQKSGWTGYIVPMAIKYSYAEPIDHILEQRISAMEQKLGTKPVGDTMQKRLAGILSEVLARDEDKFHLEANTVPDPGLTQQLVSARHALLNEIKGKYDEAYISQRRTIDQSWELSAQLREMLAKGVTATRQMKIQSDLSALHKVAQMASWQPQYIATKATPDRLAEVVLKLEREIHGIKRPAQLAKRHAFVRIAEPIDLGLYTDQYESDRRKVTHDLTTALRNQIQMMVDELAEKSAQPTT